jgi:hypothetical protein
VVPEAGNISESQVENLGVVLLGKFEDGTGISHRGSFKSCGVAGERLRKRLQVGRLLQSVALHKPTSLMPLVTSGNSIVLMGGIKRTLYFRGQGSEVRGQCPTPLR